jgi:dolichol kinase
MSTEADHRGFSSPHRGGKYAREQGAEERSVGNLMRTAGSRLDPRELRRRIWHMAPGFLPFLLWPIPHRDPISPTLNSIILSLALALAVGIFVQFRLVQRAGEDGQRLWAVLGYAGSVLLMFLLFPGMAELGQTTLAVLAFGDGSATCGGLLIGGRKLPWNSGKTIAGFACFLLVGIPMSAIIYWGEANNLEAIGRNGAVSFTTACIVAASATIMAAVAESLSSRINDNVRVGMAAGVTLAAAQWLVVGWT